MSSYKPFAANDDIPTVELYVWTVINRVPCEEHGAALGLECFWFESLISDDIIKGICNVRARKAGMTAPIRPQSLDRSLSGQPYRGQR